MSESTSTTELELCKELALLPGSLFEFTSRFVPDEQRAPLLALYALKQSIGSIPQTPVEDSVKWAKLKWWSEEFSADPASSSLHPVLRVLWLSGTRRHLDNVLLQRLISDAVLQIDAAPNSDESSMFERFAPLGSTDIQLELALDNADIATRELNYLGAATSLYRVIFSFNPNHRSETEQVPLSLLAKYNIGPMEPGQDQSTLELSQLLGELAEIGLDWYSQGTTGLKESLGNGECKHLQLRFAMEGRRLETFRKNPNSVFNPSQSFGPTDAWFAWRFLRRLM